MERKVMTKEEWMNEGKRRFGEDFMNWKFQCPMCGHVASIQEFKDAGVDNPNNAYQECIGRYIGKGAPVKGDSSGCNWVAYGLLGIPNGKGIIVTTEDAKIECFDFADESMCELSCHKDFCNCSSNCHGQGCEEAESAERDYKERTDNIPLNNNCSKCLCKDNCSGQACEESENL